MNFFFFFWWGALSVVFESFQNRNPTQNNLELSVFLVRENIAAKFEQWLQMDIAVDSFKNVFKL